MSEETNENLGDDLKDKASDMADKAKEAASEAAEDIKEGAKKVTEEAKEAASDIKEEWNKVTNDQDGKTVAILAHITIIGWIIALIMNGNNKTEVGTFYIRQTLGIFLLAIICSFIPLINFIAWIFFFVVWVISLIGAINGSKKPIFLLGTQFQEWFKGL